MDAEMKVRLKLGLYAQIGLLRCHYWASKEARAEHSIEMVANWRVFLLCTWCMHGSLWHDIQLIKFWNACNKDCKVTGYSGWIHKSSCLCVYVPSCVFCVASSLISLILSQLLLNNVTSIIMYVTGTVSVSSGKH